MFDRAARRIVDPLLDRLAEDCVSRGVSATRVTLIGFGFGLVAILLIATSHEFFGLIALLANRIADGLDGAVARRTRPTDVGGYLDIVLDFLLYSGFVFAIALGRPEQALPAAFLIFSFVGTGTTFLAFAIFDAKRGAQSAGVKSFRYLEGLTEGGETIAFFILVLLIPVIFPVAAWLFGALCWLTAGSRILTAVQELR